MKRRMQVTEYKIGRAIVRIHGDFDMDRVRGATERLVKQQMIRTKARERASETRSKTDTGAEDAVTRLGT